MILYYNPKADLPSAEDLPDSDDTPVDNELQDLIPSLLKWLYWYDEQGERYLTPEEQLRSARQETLEAQQQAREAQEQVAKLAEKLRELGIDPSSLDS